VISANNGTPLPPSVAAALRSRSGGSATSVRSGQISTFGATEQINGIDPAVFASFYRFKWAAGSNAGALAALGNNGAVISSDFATAHHLRIGGRFTAQNPVRRQAQSDRPRDPEAPHLRPAARGGDDLHDAL
jgi:hypothetical protein